MDKRKPKSEYLFMYAKYLNGTSSAAEFCKEEGIDYLEFVEFVNNWEDQHGERMVEDSLESPSYGGIFEREVNTSPSRAEKMFGEILPIPPKEKRRSITRFPGTSSFLAELEVPTPDTIVKQARLTFPSGACIELEQAALKTLILLIVLYEDFDTWTE